MKKSKVEIGQIYMGQPNGFINQIRCEVVNIYKHSAHVKIICCVDQRDEERQFKLDDQTVCPLNSLEEV